MEELINELFDNKLITKDKLEEFGKMCQLKLLYDLYINDKPNATYNNVKKSFIELKNELLIDDNKLHIITFNFSLN